MSAYWIAHVTVTDPEAYSGYQSLAPQAFAKFGANFLALGGQAVTLEGTGFDRHVVIEFPSLEQADACYRSSEYQTAAAKRAGAAITQVVIVEGLAD